MSKNICLITGGARGLGFALAQRLVAQNTTVCLLDLSRQELEAAQQKLGASCAIFPLDVTDASAVESVVKEVIHAFGQIDALVNCAGIAGETNRRSHEVNPSDFDRVFSINVKGTFLTCRAVLPFMMQRNYGRILNVASISGKEGNAGMVAYSSSKAAVIGMTKAMGKEYAETGITINSIAPAVIRTDMVAALPESQVKYMTDKIPMKRCGTLEEFAVMAEFIISPQNTFTTGFTFDLSGGRAVY